jgi:methionyl-tRNA synthetase
MSRDSKMGKSQGNAVNPMDFIERYGADELRYYLCSSMISGRDASYSEEDFVLRYNSDLANTLGNLVSRVISLIAKYFQNTIPDPGELTGDDLALVQSWKAVASQMFDRVRELRVDLAVQCVMDGVVGVNHYIDRNKPWALAKAGDIKRLASVLYASLDSIRVISELLYPIMPGKMHLLRTKILGLGEREPVIELGVESRLEPGKPLGDPVSLFPRVSSAAGAEEQKTEISQRAAARPKDFSVQQTPAVPAPVITQIAYEDFKKLRLQLALVIDVYRIEGSEKLYRLIVKTGHDTRQIVSGLAKHYSPDELRGKKIVLVSNLKPIEMFGVNSDGMLLAASDGEITRALTVDGDLSDGCPVL